MTAISFDYPGRRLLTGGHDGNLLKMWNFSNGALVKQFLKHEHASASSTAGGVGSGSTAASLATAPATAAAVSSTGSDDLTSSSDTSSASALATSPVKRKVRDIMTLPASFGVDHEGRRGGPIENADLPSPTRLRLERGRDNLTPREPASARKRPGDKDSNTVATAGPSVSGPATEAIDSASSKTEATALPVTPSVKKNRYRQQEVTSILDIERNLRVGMGDFICQRFVCSVGWDRNIFVWADKNDESEALPVHVLPNKRTLASSASKCHSMDVLALVYIPPAYIATAGLDGKILLWSLNSGEYVSKLHQSAGSIDAMFYAQKLEMLFASGETGQLVCIDRSMTTQAVISLAHPNSEGITALRCDKTNTHLVTGDAAGIVKLWDLSVAVDHEGVVLELCCSWHLGHARVLCADFIENARVAEVYLLLACGNGEVSLWTLDGVLVGCFGKHHGWQLGRPSTYAASVSSCVRFGSSSDAASASAPASQKQCIRCYSIASLHGTGTDGKETFLLEDSMPKPGEVWTCVSGHRSRMMNMNAKKQESSGAAGSSGGSSTSTTWSGAGGFGASSSTITIVRRDSTSNVSNNASEPAARETLASLPFLQHKLAEATGDVTELITVVKVTRGEVRPLMYVFVCESMLAAMLMLCMAADLVLGRQWRQDAGAAVDRDERLCAQSRLDQAHAALAVCRTHVLVRCHYRSAIVRWTRHSLTPPALPWRCFVGTREGQTCFRVSAVCLSASDPVRLTCFSVA